VREKKNRKLYTKIPSYHLKDIKVVQHHPCENWKSSYSILSFILPPSHSIKYVHFFYWNWWQANRCLPEIAMLVSICWVRNTFFDFIWYVYRWATFNRFLLLRVLINFERDWWIFMSRVKCNEVLKIIIVCVFVYD
jgi:hypothetical protein